MTVAYEQARGLREPNQATSGFQMSASKTVAAHRDSFIKLAQGFRPD